jgi:predicted kinase
MRELLIFRGIPGSGKSTKAKQLLPKEHIFEADDFWMKSGQYIFDPSQLGMAHKWTEKRVENAMRNNITPIGVSNTNIKKREFKHYLALAEKYGYNVRFEMPETPWWNEIYPRIRDKTFTEKDIQVFYEKNTHGVPYEKLRLMMETWQEV